MKNLKNPSSKGVSSQVTIYGSIPERTHCTTGQLHMALKNNEEIEKNNFSSTCAPTGYRHSHRHQKAGLL